jgi:hypothetical protein
MRWPLRQATARAIFFGLGAGAYKHMQSFLFVEIAGFAT